MDKEYWLVGAITLLILASVLDYFAGAVSFSVGTNPFSFLSPNNLVVYPFTAVAIGLRALGMVVLILSAVSTIEKQFGFKAFGLFVIGVLAELYAVQQLATGSLVTPLNWTLAFAYAGVLLIPVTFYYLLRAALSGINSEISGQPEEPESKSRERIKKIKDLDKE